MTGPEPVAQALAKVRERIRRAAEQSGRDPAGVRLVAVSKRQPVEQIRAAYAAGQRDFGENYAQELLAKEAELVDLPDLRFHMIGGLQRNKVAGLIGHISALHSVDSLRLIAELGRRAALRPVPPARRLLPGGELAVFLELNLGAEAHKAGCAPAELGALIEAVLAQPSLSLRGLMAIPAGAGEPESARQQFALLQELRERHGGAARLPELSIGMSRDLELAVACGSSWVRVGTDIFGARTG
jgi:pyridoxal phosphate enzyme (YggS family)